MDIVPLLAPAFSLLFSISEINLVCGELRVSGKIIIKTWMSSEWT
jgi:hypothetical protein